MKNDFFPDADYKLPITSNYMRLVEGVNKFRVLSSAIVGYEYFGQDNKPVRSREPFDETPNIKTGGRVNHFWAFVVFNRIAERIQILEITQKSIMSQMKSYIDSPDWGNPKQYDLSIVRKGMTKNDTEYQVIPSPHKELESEIKDKYEAMTINLDALYSGDDPFAQSEKSEKSEY